MIGAMWNGMIGISTFDKAISIESNNVSNSGTVGHKLDQVTFEDLMYKNGYGKGVGIQSITKNFEQGNIQITNVDLDASIEGKGFFITKERASGDIFYTRAGNFQQAEDGFLESQEKMKILGLSPQSKLISTTNPIDNIFTNEFSKNVTSSNLNLNNTVYNINTKVTDYNSTATDSLVNGNNYKTASSKINDVDLLKSNYINKIKDFQSNPNINSAASTIQISEVNFSSSLNELKNENDYLSVTIGNNVFRQNFVDDINTTLKALSDKLSNSEGLTSSVDTNSGILTIKGLIPGKEFRLSGATINEGYIPTLTSQSPISGSGLGMIASAKDAFKVAVENAGGKFLEITNILSYGDLNSIGSDEINLRLNSLGLVNDVKGKVSISDDGLVFVTDDENSFLVSKISTAHFRDEQGLDAVGGNTFKETEESGRAFNANILNKVVSSSLEKANVNYSNTLSTLLFYQKAFEANSKSISISDEFIKTAVDMKK
jgi:flagellar hook protein FlgE